MKASSKAYDLIRKSEGLFLRAYRCPAGVLTIGYGHTSGIIKPGMVISSEEAERFLAEDVAKCEAALDRQNLELTQEQYDALIDFIFNVGEGNFASSTLLNKIRQNPNDRNIAAQFRRWVYSKGKILPGLVDRRIAEIKLYFS